jgi:hypothetical protein
MPRQRDDLYLPQTTRNEMIRTYNDLSIPGFQRILTDHIFLGYDLTSRFALCKYYKCTIVNCETRAGDGWLDAGLGRPLPVHV